MIKLSCCLGSMFAVGTTLSLVLVSSQSPAADAPPKVPRFSISYMDKSVEPGSDFFHFAAGNWTWCSTSSTEGLRRGRMG